MKEETSLLLETRVAKVEFRLFCEARKTRQVEEEQKPNEIEPLLRVYRIQIGLKLLLDDHIFTFEFGQRRFGELRLGGSCLRL